MKQNRVSLGRSVMVVSPHYLASTVGAKILAKGGNAFDAAVAVSATLAVVYPHMTGVGGDSFWLVYSAEEGQVRAYNGSGRSGYKATRQAYPGEEHIPSRGIRSIVTVPGMVDSWAEMVQSYGRLSLSEVLQPAIRYAEQGFPCSISQSKFSSEFQKLLQGIEETASIYLPSGRSPLPGQQFRQKNLAASLKQIATEGRDAFYKGELARRITSFLEQNGGLLSYEDFAEHSGDWQEPLVADYRGYSVYQAPPNSQGFTGLMTLNILEQVDFSQVEHGSFEYYHLLIEALKLSFRDRNRYLSDPDFCHIPLKQLLSPAYAQQLFQQICMQSSLPVEALTMGSDTAYAAVVDEEGNAVSFIQSLYFEFGSAVTAGDTGILMQNRGSFFSLDPDHVNSLEPRKRTFHTLMPAMACLDGKPTILYGTQGGEGQPQTQTALLTRMIDYGMDPQQAINQPRWLWGRTWGEASQDLRLEGRIEEHVQERLSQVGHRVKLSSSFDEIMGHAQAIKLQNGLLYGGSDPRADGRAIGW